ncbi:MAG: competence protein ComFB [Clostridiales bacterium]|jgi:competence protein ComFB|nr:competence protein ComFB [Clostridiales bacterium]
MLKNYMEKIVEETYETVIKDYPECCTCAQCREDVMAICLNQLPPLYLTTEIGEVYSKAHEMELQFRIRAIQTVAEAIEKVSKNPRHG